MARPRIVVARKLPEPVEARLAAEFDAVLNADDRPLSRDAMAAAMREADGLLPAVTDPVDAALLATEGRRVRIVANFGVGVNNIDLEAAKAAGVVVTNTPGVLTDATADLAMALILAATRRMSETEAILRAGGWDGFRPTGWLGMGLQGKTLGIVGMGRIGQATARRAALGFGMRIAYFNRSAVGPFDFAAEPLPSIRAVLAAADVVSLHIPGGGGNAAAISAEMLAAMKPTAYLVNTARGDVVDEAALIEALARRADRRRRPRRLRRGAEGAGGAAGTAERDPPAPHRQRDDRDADGDGHAGGRQPRRLLRRTAAAGAGGVSGCGLMPFLRCHRRAPG